MNSNKVYTFFFVGLSVLSINTAPTVAAPAPIITSTQSQGDTANRFGVGLTRSIAKRPFVGVDDQSASLPYFSYQKNQFYIEGQEIGYKLFENKSYTASLLASPRFYEVKSSFAKSGELSGIEETKPTYLAGVSSQIKKSFATFTVQILHDIVESDGNEFIAQASKTFSIHKDFSLTPSVGLTYQDKNLVSHFYGVQANEIAAGRPQYDGDSSVNYNATINASWYITKNIQLLGQYKYETLGDGITDSPIVDEDAVDFFTLGAVYRF